MSDKLWDGRFSERTNRRVEAFTSSIAVDSRLYDYDIEGSIAHCTMLARTGIITDAECTTLVEGLRRIRRQIERGQFTYDDSLEDIHMHVEAALLQEVGKVAQKLHTARSRNDQVALDIRMFLRKETADIIRALADLRTVLVQLAADHVDVILPGYTHLQRAQPVLLAHHLLAYFEMFSRDSDRLTDALTRINVMPLGCAALAGTTYPIDRQLVAELLEFPALAENSMDAVSDRDFIMEFLAAAGICMLHLSRFSEELILWSTSEFRFVELDDAFATGSSIMPQKKNPDIPELVRGKTGRVVGALVSVMTMIKSLPLAYNRDMQEDKPPLFDAVDTLAASIDIFTRMLPTIRFNRERMHSEAATGFLNATDLADYLVENGMTFRQAHSVVGQAVSFAIENRKELHELTLKELKAFASVIKKDVFGLLTPESVVNRRTSYGGTAARNVTEAIGRARDRIAADLDALPVFNK